MISRAERIRRDEPAETTQADQGRVVLGLLRWFVASGKESVCVNGPEGLGSRRLARMLNELAGTWELPARAKAQGQEVVLVREDRGMSETRITIRREEKCSQCHGTGTHEATPYPRVCTPCGGEGWTRGELVGVEGGGVFWPEPATLDALLAAYAQAAARFPAERVAVTEDSLAEASMQAMPWLFETARQEHAALVRREQARAEAMGQDRTCPRCGTLAKAGEGFDYCHRCRARLGVTEFAIQTPHVHATAPPMPPHVSVKTSTWYDAPQVSEHPGPECPCPVCREGERVTVEAGR